MQKSEENMFTNFYESICSFHYLDDNNKMEIEENKAGLETLFSLKDLIENFIKKQESEYPCIFSNIKKKKQQLKVFFTSKRYFGNYFLNFTFHIELKTSQMSLTVMFYYNIGEPIVIDNNVLRLLIGRFFTKLNGTLRLGNFSICPASGEIIFKIKPYVKGSIENIVKNGNFLDVFEILFYTGTHASYFYFYKILYMANLINENTYLQISKDSPNNKIRTFEKEQSNSINEMNNCLSVCHLSFDNKFAKEDLFKLPKNYKSENFIFSQLEIMNIEKEVNFMSGGFADIFKAKVKLQEKNEFSYKTMVIKKDKKRDDTHNNKNLNFSRVLHEKKILSQLKALECPFIAKFYFSDNKLYESLIFMELYQNKSLDIFKNAHSLTMTLQTKLYFLYQIAMGLHFLHTNGICHLDIKPANILINKNYVCKLTDFGESINYLSEIDNNYKPGRTLPFAAPEIFQSSLKITPKFDVFSYGILLSEMIFDIYPISFKRNNLKELQNKYRNNTYSCVIIEENVVYKGPKHLMKILRNLVLKCIEFEVSERCNIEYIIFIMKNAMSYLDKNY